MYSNYLILILTSTFASMLTFFVNERLGQGPVRASALSSLLVAGFFYFFPNSMDEYLVRNIPAVFLGGSFIGMVSSKVLSSYYRIALSGFIFGIIFINTSYFFTGFGGALGTIASISLLVSLSLPFFNIKGKLTTGLLQIRKIIYPKKRK